MNFIYYKIIISSLSYDMNTDGNAEDDFDTDIKDGNAVDENIDDTMMTMTEMRIQGYMPMTWTMMVMLMLTLTMLK